MSCYKFKNQGCGAPMNSSEAGPAMITGEWNIGGRKCAGGLKKCQGTCGNFYCSNTGKCDNSKETLQRYLQECYVQSGSAYKDVSDLIDRSNKCQSIEGVL